MILPALFFYLFAGVCIACAFMVIAARNPVHSVLYLILAFVNASGLFVMLGAEFLAMILIVVYVGAVAVLFLFVIMMLDVDFAELRQGFLQYLPLGALLGAVAVLFLFVIMMLDVDFAELRQGFLQYLPLGALLFFIFVLELGGVVFTWAFVPDISQSLASPIQPLATVSNTAALGQVLYTRYIYFFQASGLVLLVAMVGAIVLTLRHKPNVKRQNVEEQVARTKATAIEVVKVASGQGLS